MKYEERLLNDAEIGDRVEEFFYAMCNLLTRALDGLV